MMMIIIINNISRFLSDNQKIIATRSTYFIFCCRNRNWDGPDINAILILFFLNNSISNSQLSIAYKYRDLQLYIHRQK